MEYSYRRRQNDSLKQQNTFSSYQMDTVRSSAASKLEEALASQRHNLRQMLAHLVILENVPKPQERQAGLPAPRCQRYDPGNHLSKQQQQYQTELEPESELEPDLEATNEGSEDSLSDDSELDDPSLFEIGSDDEFDQDHSLVRVDSEDLLHMVGKGAGEVKAFGGKDDSSEFFRDYDAIWGRNRWQTNSATIVEVEEILDDDE